MFRMIFTLVFLALAGTAQAQSADKSAVGEIRSGWRESDGKHLAGLTIRLAPGWKTYWRAPGEGGIPPQFNWSGSSNLKSVSIRYPTPKVLSQNGLQSIGYDQDVTYALIVRPKQADKPIDLRGEIDIGVCQDICVPITLRVRGTLPPRGEHDATIAKSLKDQPKRGGTFACDIEPIADGLRLRASVPLPKMRTKIAVVEPGEPGVWTSESTLARNGNRLIAEVEMVPPNAAPFALARNDVRLTLIGDGAAVEMKGCR